MLPATPWQSIKGKSIVAENTHINNSSKQSTTTTSKDVITSSNIKDSSKEFQTIMATNTAAFISLMLFGLCYSCPIPGGCPDLSGTYNQTIANGVSLNTTVSISHRNVDFRYIDLINDLFNPPQGSPEVLNENCTGAAPTRFSVGAYNSTRCPWHYVCDYNAQRIPPFIYHAKCSNSAPVDGSNDGRLCREVYSKFFYLTTESCEPLSSEAQWTGRSINIPVACTDAPAF